MLSIYNQTVSIIASSTLLLGLSACSQGIADKDVSERIVLDASSSSAQEFENLPYSEYFNYELFKLENGLTVLVHEDNSKSDVAVSVTFHVGSKNEPDGKSGFAHVFEHLAFNGTKRNPGEYFKYLDEIGAYSPNGSTGYDYTNYYQVVPRTSLERLLWLEADRMMNIGSDASQESLDTQIDVIINEKRLGENQPFGGTSEMSVKALYPKNHPYSHTIIGSEEDLKNATLEDVKAWYKKYYGASNALLVMAGNVTAEDGKRLAENYFKHVPPGPSLAKVTKWELDRKNITVQKNYDISPVSEISRSYSIPAITSAETAANAAAFMTIGQGDTSFLRRRLVDDLGVAVQVSAGVSPRELDASAYITVYPADGVSLETLGKHLDEAIEEFLEAGPSADDIANIYGQMRSSLVYVSDDITSKAVLMGANYYANGDPLFRLKFSEWVRLVTPSAVRDAARKILPYGYHEERNYAQAETVAADASADIDIAPEIGEGDGVSVPDPSIFKLNNGLEVVLVNRPSAPLIAMNLSVPLGSDNLSPVDQEKMDVAMEFAMQAGAKGLTKQQQKAKLASMGASFNTSLQSDMATYSVSTDSTFVDDVLGLFKTIIVETSFEDADFKDFIKEKIEIAKIGDKHIPDKGREILNSVFLGEDNVVSSQEKLAIYAELDPAKSQKLFTNWLKPSGARLYISGDMSVEDAKSKLNKVFADWTGDVPELAKFERKFPQAPKRPKFLLLNNEGADQTAITALRRLKPMPKGDNYIAKISNEIFGGSFTSRLNTNLREAKGWTYGIRHGLREAEQIDIGRLSASVTDVHTVDAVKEIMKEMRSIKTNRSVTALELSEVTQKEVRSFNTNTNYDVLRVLQRSDAYNQDYNYYEGMEKRYERVSVDDVNNAARDMFNENEYVWVLIGNLDTFETELREAKLGDIIVYNAAGEVVR